METQKPKIAMYAKRPFGEKLNASFDFIKENWRLLFKFITYLLLPLSLVQALSLNGIMGGISSLSSIAYDSSDGLERFGVMFFISYGGYIILSLLGMILLTSLIYAMIKTYNEREERLQNITLKDLQPLLFKNIKRMILLVMGGVVLGVCLLVVFVLLVLLTPFTLILTIPSLIAIAIPLGLWSPIYLFEDISLMESLKKTFRLGFATWGGIFLIYMVMGIIANVLQGVTTVPWYVATLVKFFFSMSDAGSNATTVSAGYNFMLYLLAIIQSFGAYLSMVFMIIGIVYQYGHASEVVDSVTVESDIDNFDKL